MMIIGVLCLVAWPLLYWLFSPLEWKYALALEAHKKGDLEKAQVAYEQIVASDPSNALALFRLGELAFERKEFEKSAEFAERSLEYARAEQKPHVINLQSNAYVALGNKEKALDSVSQLHSFSTLPSNYKRLTKEELVQLMNQPGNRHFLNSLAYVAAVANDDLNEAYRYIDAVIQYFETKEKKSQLAIPYLYERSSEYSFANDSLVRLANQVKGRVKNRAKIESRILEVKSQLEKNADDSKAKERLKRLVETGEHEMLFIIFSRLNLLAAKLNSENVDSLVKELDCYRSEFVNEKTSRVELDDATYVEYAFELHHYYDTRAYIRLRMGEELVAKSMGQKDDFPRFLQAMEAANELYRKAYDDLIYAIELKSAMEKYLAKFPNNSLAITLPSDDMSKVIRDKRTKAVEHYHRYLILNALGRIEDAEIYKSKIVDLGFEPGPLLF